jgi:hypothetical protein
MWNPSSGLEPTGEEIAQDPKDSKIRIPTNASENIRPMLLDEISLSFVYWIFKIAHISSEFLQNNRTSHLQY